jgi:2-iminobutanoate/2-iminopropanoate deaminase
VKPITTTKAPAAIGPYSQAIDAGSGLVVTSGQIALDPATGKLVEGGVRPETEQVMKNLAAVLEAGGCAFTDVVKTTIYLADMADFQTVNEIYGRAFEGTTPPARSTVQVAGLPRGARVEIDAMAVRSARGEAR